MSITVDAVYENGVLKPSQSLPIKEHEWVRVTVHSSTEANRAPVDEAETIVRRSHGLLGWTGDVETLRHLAEDADFDPQESA